MAASRRGSISCLLIRPETHRCWWVAVGGVPARRHLRSRSLSSFLRCSGEVVCPGHVPRASGQRCPQSRAPGASARRGSPTSPPTPGLPSPVSAPLPGARGTCLVHPSLESCGNFATFLVFLFLHLLRLHVGRKRGFVLFSFSHGTPAPCEALGLLPLLSDPAEARGLGVWTTGWAG